MKKALVLTLLMLVLSVSGMVFVSADVDEARDQVEITKMADYGDASVAEGLEVLIRTHYNHHLLWDTSYSVDSDASVQTDYRFFQAEQNENGPIGYAGVSLMTGVEYGLDLARDEAQFSIAAAYKELFAQTPAGTEKSTTVRLKDYYDFYPFRVSLELPGNLLRWDANPNVNIDDSTPGTEAYVIRAFQKFFKVPVLEDETLEISVRKNADGKMGGRGSGSTESDRFHIWAMNAITDDACYFVFNAHTLGGNVVDTSLIPGGYGIYRLPYIEESHIKNGQLVTGILIDEMTMAYSLDPTDSPLRLYVNPDQTKLLLLTMEDDTCALTVIDIATMKTQQRLELGKVEPDGGVWDVFYYDEFLTVWLSGNRLSLVEVTDTGEYELCFTVEVTDEKDKLFLLSTNAVMGWDGEKLVIADFLSNAFDRDHINDSRYCSIYLAVYDKTGLLYFGEYLNGLDVGNGSNDYNDRCQHTNYLPLSVRWAE